MSRQRTLRRTAPSAALCLVALLTACTAAPPAETPGSSPTSTPRPAETIAGPTLAPVATPAASPPPTAATAESPAGPTVPSPVARQPGEWTAPVRISEAAYTEPALVVDADGFAHVAAVREGSIFHLTDRTGSWTEQRLSTPPGTGLQAEADGQPSIAVDDEGTLAIAFTRWGPDDTFGRLPRGIHYVTNRAGAWSAPALLVDEAGGGHSPSLVLSEGRVHLAYVMGVAVDIVTDDASFPVHYGSAPEGQPWNDVVVAANGTEPVLALAPDGGPRILFGDDYALLDGDGLRLAAGAAAGGFEVAVIPGTSRYARPYDMALDGDVVHALWSRPGWASSDDRWAAYAQTLDGSWAEPQLLVLDGTVSGVAVAADGSVHAVGGNLEGIWYGRDEGAELQQTQLSDRVELASDIAVEPTGRPHVVFVAGDAGAEELWYLAGAPD